MYRLLFLAGLLTTTVSAHIQRLDGRIIGGEDAWIQDLPYQISLQTFDSHMCGASIIAAKWAITAAHCTDNHTASDLTIVAGISNLKENGQRINVFKIHQNHVFSPLTYHEDVSVLELASEINLGPNAQPITLASDDYDPPVDTNVLVSGWGTLYSGGDHPDQLQKVTVRIVSRESCGRSYGREIIKEQTCAGVPEGGKDACQGDSGGPLVRDGKLVGIVSWGYGCGHPVFPGIYANVGPLRHFIREVSGI